ncbi:SdrD B-like domain-containing protein [Fibrella sp. ES10-3-2-2]|nr:hypothetical protein A6C57_02780 [Fibrella sp. ES10-3-2-2]
MQQPPTLACAITINRVVVSGCYSVSGVSKATVSVEVGWQEVTAGAKIIVTLSDSPGLTNPQSRTITPGAYNTTSGDGTIVTPQVVSFEVNADGSTKAIQAFTGNTYAGSSCRVETSAGIPPACPPTLCTSDMLGGTVFNDYDNNGTKGTGETAGIANVLVKAITCVGTSYTATTDAFGKYTMNVPVNLYPVRVEFGNLPAYAGQGTLNGIDGRTTVQFVTAPDCTVDLGILDNNDYCQATPKLIIPCYVYGDPLPGSSTAGQLEALVAFDYGTSGGKDMSKITPLAVAKTIGTTWGVAYDKYRKKVYTSATLKRHAGLGPLGLGGIYVTDMVSQTTGAFIDVAAAPLNINVGASVVGNPWFGVTNASRGLTTDATAASNDPLSFTAIGKIGIGDLEISEDGNSLYFVNLFDKKLYQLSITGATPTLVGSWAIPDPGCAGGAMRPFATKVYKGKVYVGSVCDAFTSQDKSSLRAYVNAFNGNTFSPVFDFPLTYPKGAAQLAAAFQPFTGWYAWTDSFSAINTGAQSSSITQLIHPQPMLSDIEFDIDGSMILAFGDRTGLQTGYRNYDLTSTTTLYSGVSGGDILRAALTSTGTYILENNASVPGFTGAGANNNQGPGFGEFYNDDFLGSTGGGLHAEIAFGALALKPGSGEVIISCMDPVDRNIGGLTQSGGIRYLSNTTGRSPSGLAMGFILYNSAPTSSTATDESVGTFAKATGLGDMEVSCDLPLYLEIGNRVWLDSDGDGEQDACEQALAGVTVALYQNGQLVASTTTNQNGEYYFINNPQSTSAVSTTVLLPATAYQLVFGTGGQFTANRLTANGGSYQLTVANTTGSNQTDATDSDAQLATVNGITAPVISLTTGSYGTTNHTYDVGFICATPATVASVSVTPASCDLTTNTGTNDARITLSGILNADKVALVAAGQAIPSYTATINTAVLASSASLTGISNPISSSGTSYSVVLFNGPDCATTILSVNVPRANCSCALTVTASAGNCNPVTNAYTLTGMLSLTNTPAGNFTIANGLRATIVSVTAGQTSLGFSLTGLPSTGTNQVVTVTSSGTACGTVSASYVAPASCTIAASISVSSVTVCYGTSVTLVASGCVGTVTWSDSSTGTTLVVPNPTSTTSYTATCTTVTQTASAIGTVTVNPQPVLTLNSATVCAGSSLTLLADGCLGGTVHWSTGATTFALVVTPLVSTSYSATCTLPTGCLSIATTTVTINPVPNYSQEPRVTMATCLGTTARNDARIDLTGLANCERADIVPGSSYSNGPAYGSTSNKIVVDGSVSFTDLPNPATPQPYTIRLYSANGNCYTDIPVLVNPTTCDCAVKNCIPILIGRIK